MRKILTESEIKEILKNTSYELVGEFKGSMVYNTFRSKDCSHSFDILWRNLKRKISNGENKCKKCSIQDKINDTKVKNLKEEISKLTQREYKLISSEKEYLNNKSTINVLHKSCGHIFETNFSNFQQGRRCPKCANKSKESKTAQILKKLLEHLNFDFEEEKKFSDCKNPFTDFNLRFDIYIKDINTVIEIDGEQHYIPIERFGGQRALFKTQYLDSLKNKFCLINKINIIRVSLYDFKNNRKKSYEEMKLEVFYLLNILINKKLSYNKKVLSKIR